MIGFLEALAIMAALAILIGLILGVAAIKYKVDEDPLVDKIDAILPQTQCGQCGYPGCKPYATAVASGEAGINQCVPGGDECIHKLADLLGRDYVPMDGELAKPKPKSLAVIDENTCIGCTLCIQACPVDAIVGSAKHLHTVIAQECTGCELCVAPCPVDCIDIVPVKESVTSWKWQYPVISLKPVAAEKTQ